ncbi:sulfatase-like hydrolase/transferase [Pontiella sulfatireligans]|uniref:Arylsulfatase n=1 Tax=Pontiella sulfatireligans TaxID=2750658 RepID=A0A6C2UGA2_9BACT|nr:sulfatase-like hydrolase/transferase [Pontiella sulfatireligans]SPS74185.1 sulfatase S1_24 [Kiritimatiellales bacterium]VGO18547.1 Arylsulfatase [Pontiella sulfatireligans]
MKKGALKKFVVPPLGGFVGTALRANRLKAGLHTFACIMLTMSCAVAAKPNVVIIMVDDLGAEGVGCYGNTGYSTPNIDRLASQGARFNNAYGTPSCSPSRAMILSGLYTNRSGILERLGSGTPNCLPGHIPTFADLFQKNGYRTGIAGKWHLGDFDFYPDHPTSHGFDDYFMWLKNYDFVTHERYYDPVVWQDQKITTYDGKYGPDLYCEFICNFIEENKERPFLAYYPMALVHKEFHQPPKLEGIKHFLPESAASVDKTFGLMVAYTDLLVGRIMDKLDELGLTENTLLIFTADNGTPNAITCRLGDQKVKGGKLSLIESGYRVPYIARWPGKIPVGVCDAFFTHADLFPSLAGLTGLPMDYDVSGMDLSHNFLNTAGKDRDFIYLGWEGGLYMVRDKRFRLHEDGRFYDIPVTSNEARYSEKKVSPADFPEASQRLQTAMAEYMKIKQTDTSYSIIPFKGYKKYKKEAAAKAGTTSRKKTKMRDKKKKTVNKKESI